MIDRDEHWERIQNLRRDEFRDGKVPGLTSFQKPPLTIDQQIEALERARAAAMIAKEKRDAETRFPAKNTPSAKIKLTGNPEIDFVLEIEAAREAAHRKKSESDAQRERLLWEANHSTSKESALLATPSAAAADAREAKRQQAIRAAHASNKDDLDGLM